jgi:DNA (cytosine-5)-methyltransferase 1
MPPHKGMPQLRTVDLFSGCGGLSLGFAQADFDIVAAYDNWPLAARVYRQNFSHPVHLFDLANVPAAVRQLKKDSPDVIIGGPPCQDFSIAGKRIEARRASLTVAFAKICCGLKAGIAVMENVYNIEKSQTLAQAKRIFKRAGYGLTTQVIDASLAGVPQMRRRLFLIAQLGGSDDFFKEELHRRLAATQMTVADYFGERLGVQYYYAHPRSYKRRAVFSIHEPSATIRRVNRPIPKTYVRHPADKAAISRAVRVLTTSERAELQTFPRDFVFLGSPSEQEHLIANAVPVKLAQFVANTIADVLIALPQPSPGRVRGVAVGRSKNPTKPRVASASRRR